MCSLLTDIQLVLSHEKSKAPNVSRLVRGIEATKYRISVAFQRFLKCRDKILAP